MNAIEKNYEMAQLADKYDDDLVGNLEDAEMREQLYKAIEHLPEQKRQVCLYKLEGNISNREIAEKMKISVSTVKTHYSQATQMLRMHLGKLFTLFIMILWF
jgi:RNA polymerase sigma-70 factor (ECF subfamily)